MGPEDVEEDLSAVLNMRDADASPMCFLSAVRPCGPACLAFVTHPKLSKVSELTEEQAHCAFINNSERCGRGVIMVGQAAGEIAIGLRALLNRAKTSEADKARTGQFQNTSSQTPFGGKGSKT